jgi:hypothetical protein
VIQRVEWTLLDIVAAVRGDVSTTGNAVLRGSRVDVVVFERAPEMLNEDVVNGPLHSAAYTFAMAGLRDMLRKRIPLVILQKRRMRNLNRIRRTNSQLSAELVFSAVYEKEAWGKGGDFDSGSGSKDAVAGAYVQLVREILQETGARHVVDIGCGDFSVASRFIDNLDTYVGVDVVPTLIEHNQKMFGRDGVGFEVIDAAMSDLPSGDLCLVRQVLQHLSNSEIESILVRCTAFPLVIITEHWPAPRKTVAPNLDKPHGPDTRIPDGSWVDIRAKPFSRAGVTERLSVIAEQPLIELGETIKTFAWTPEP